MERAAGLVCCALLAVALAGEVQSAPPPSAKPAFHALRIAASGELLAAPDGSLLAGIDTTRHSVRLYDLSGRVHGRVRVSGAATPRIRWLPDSSAVVIWTRHDAPAPVLLLDRRGRTTRTRFDDGDDLALSPNGRWLADTILTRGGEAGAQVALRTGGRARTLARGTGIRLLGWQRDRIVYFDHRQIYSVSPRGGAIRRLAAAPHASPTLRPPVTGPVSSSDGRVTIVATARELYYALVGRRLRALPSRTPTGTAGFLWTGPHDLLSQSRSGELVFLDLVRAAVARRTGIATSGWVQAVSASRVASLQGEAVHLLDLRTRADLDVGKAPVAGSIEAVGRGRFLLHGSGKTYIFP